MALTVREKISARILAIVGGVAGVAALRPKRVHWTDEVTKHLTAVVRQGDLRFTHEDADGSTGTFRCEQDYAVTLAVIESDAAATTYETAMNAAMADIIEALAADMDLADNADWQGLRFNGIASVEDDIRLARSIAGETLSITVAFVTGRTNMETNLR